MFDNLVKYLRFTNDEWCDSTSSQKLEAFIELYPVYSQLKNDIEDLVYRVAAKIKAANHEYWGGYVISCELDDSDRILISVHDTWGYGGSANYSCFVPIRMLRLPPEQLDDEIKDIKERKDKEIAEKKQLELAKQLKYKEEELARLKKELGQT